MEPETFTASQQGRRTTRSRVAAVALCCLGLGACDGTIFRQANVGEYSVLSVDARQRLVISGPRVDETGKTQTVICLEPSPDAIVAKASYLAADTTVERKAAGKVAAGLNEAAASLSARTQSIQLLRDGYYRICEAYLNGAIGQEEYKRVIHQIDQFMIVLVAIEAVTGVPVAPAVSIGTGGTLSLGADGHEIDGSAEIKPAVLKSIAASTKALTPEQVAAVTRIIEAYFQNRR